MYQIGSLGDTIVSIPALRAIRAHFGERARIDLLHDVNKSGLVTSEEVLAGTGLVQSFLPYSAERSAAGKLGSAFDLWRRLRPMRFDAVVSLLPSDRPKAALARDRTFFRLCGIRRMIGFRPLPRQLVHPRDENGCARASSHEAVLRLERLHRDGILSTTDGCFRLPLLTVDAGQAASVRNWLRARRREPGRVLVAIAPGCNKRANAWPAERFIDLSRRILTGRRAEIVVVGGAADRGIAERMAAAWGGEGIVAAGSFSVAGSAALLSHCGLLIGLDTGTTHLAAAVNVPCVIIQSANSHPGHWDPLGQGHTVVRRSPLCAGCLHFECPVEGHPCMNEITVDEVWRAVERILDKCAGKCK